MSDIGNGSVAWDKQEEAKKGSNGTVVMVPDSSPEPRRTAGDMVKSCLRSNIFLFFLLAGIIAGVLMGIGIRLNHPDFIKNERNIMYLKYPGDLFMRMLKMIIVPLVVTSLIAGMAAIPSKAAGRLGGFTLLYYLITTIMAVLLGMLLVATIKPGNSYEERNVTRKIRPVHPADSGLDLIRNVFPNNLIAATFEKTVTKYNKNSAMVNKTVNGTLVEVKKEVIDYDDFYITTASGTNILGLVVFSCVFGVIIGRMGPRGLPVYRFMSSMQDGIIQLVQLIIWFAPIGICFILASKIASMSDPLQDFAALGFYILTVLVGLFIHAVIILPIIYFLFTRKNPFMLMLHVSQALLTALGTASSSATMPVTIKNLTYRARLDPRVVKFVVPVGATVNMDGTALYEAVASIFIAQININLGLFPPMSASDYVMVSVTATLAAIGAAGVPEAGLVTMMIVLEAIGLPTEDVFLILAVDWFLDRCRTAVNVWGDSIGTGIVNSLSSKYLYELDAQEKEQTLHVAPYDPNIDPYGGDDQVINVHL